MILRNRIRVLLVGALTLTAGASSAHDPEAETDASDSATPAAPLPESIAPEGYVLLPRVGSYARAPLHVDPIEAAIARGDWRAPNAGDEVRGADGKVHLWRTEADAPPPSDLRGGYAYAEFESPAAGVMLLEARGCAAAWLNGEWIVGDPYSVGWFRPPVSVVEGTNRLLLHLANPTARARLVKPEATVALLGDRAIVPDALIGDASPLQASVPLVNASDAALEDAQLVVAGGDPVPLPWIAPKTITTLTFQLTPSTATEPGEGSVRVEVLRRPAQQEEENAEPAKASLLAATDLSVRDVSPDDVHTRTHVSAIDGSVQPYSVLPAESPPEGGKAGVLLLLHDAGEDHASAIRRCERLPDLHIVAPGGRGRYGFDWEDWSATDALEALDDFAARTPSDASRVSVTGRGMGGHGALRIATLAPERFAAAAPVGAWLSFYTQGRARTLPPDATRAERALERRTASGDLLRVIENLAPMGVYVAHAPDDRVVSPADSRLLRTRLSEFHSDFAYREADDAGAIAPGSPLVEFCRGRESQPRSASPRISFSTSDLGKLAAIGWVRIEAQGRQGETSRVELTRDLKARRFVGATENVDRLAFDLTGLSKGKPLTVVLDGEPSVSFQWPRRTGVVRVARDSGGRWRRTRGAAQGPVSKGPARPGGLKSAFANRPLLVFGTQGSTEEQRWCLAKARYDSMLFLYRGAGKLDLLPDSRLDLRDDPSRNIVLYGSSDTNRVYRFLMHTSPIWVDRGVVEVGPRPEVGDELATAFVRPRWNSGRATVALIGGTGLTGMNLTTRLRYFWSGIDYPDSLIFGPAEIDSADDDGAIDPQFRGDLRAVGEFGADWTAESGEIIWRDVAM